MRLAEVFERAKKNIFKLFILVTQFHYYKDDKAGNELGGDIENGLQIL